MSAIYTYLVVGAIVMVTVKAQVLTPSQPSPNGTYMCYNNTVTVSFLQNQTNGLTYKRVSVEGHPNTTGCFIDKVDANGMFVLYVTDLTACGINDPNGDGMVSFKVRIHYVYPFDTHEDTITTISCNVTALGPSVIINETFGVNGTIAVVPGRVSVPVVKPMTLAEKFGAQVSFVLLGAPVWLCLDIDYSSSLYKGSLVDDVYSISPRGKTMYLIKNRCLGTDVPHANVKLPETNATTSNIYIEFSAFRFYRQSTVKLRVKMTFFKDKKMQDGSSCGTRKKRSVNDKDTVSRVFTLSIPVTSSNDDKIITKEEVNVVEQNSDNNNNNNNNNSNNKNNVICEGHISATTFYAVVAVLAIFLLLMIGVTVLVAARNRSGHVMREEKDKAF